jgi:ABC-type transport system substrate-binding protein
MSGSTAYESHFEDDFDLDRAERILVDRFCELGDDGIYSCQGRRMSFKWATTVGDDDRERVFELASESLKQIGIELVPLFMTPSRLFSSEVFFGGPDVWQIMSFSWKASADPYQANSTYYCEGDAPSGFGDLNVNRYCDREVETLVRSTDTLVEESDRVAAYNEADNLYLSDLAIIPLYQKPSFAVWTSTLTGPQLNPSRSTDLWNVGAWSGQETVVIAVQGEPRLGNPILAPVDEMAIIRSPMLSGAFGVTPDLEYVPVLVEDVELIVETP